MRVAVFLDVTLNDPSITFEQVKYELMESGDMEFTVYLDAKDDFAFELKPVSVVELID